MYDSVCVCVCVRVCVRLCVHVCINVRVYFRMQVCKLYSLFVCEQRLLVLNPYIPHNG